MTKYKEWYNQDNCQQITVIVKICLQCQKMIKQKYLDSNTPHNNKYWLRKKVGGSWIGITESGEDEKVRELRWCAWWSSRLRFLLCFCQNLNAKNDGLRVDENNFSTRWRRSMELLGCDSTFKNTTSNNQTH